MNLIYTSLIKEVAMSKFLIACKLLHLELRELSDLIQHMNDKPINDNRT